MKNRLFALVLALVMALSLFGCGQKPAADDTGDAPETVTVTDMIGRELELTPGSYQRVVCIGAGALRLYSSGYCRSRLPCREPTGCGGCAPRR